MEIWDPVTCTIKQASCLIADRRTRIPLKLKPDDAIFIVFIDKERTGSKVIPEPVEKMLVTVKGPWQINFQRDRGAPQPVSMGTLIPWNESTISGIKYFSGTAIYNTTLTAPENWFGPEEEIWIWALSGILLKSYLTENLLG